MLNDSDVSAMRAQVLIILSSMPTSSTTTSGPTVNTPMLESWETWTRSVLEQRMCDRVRKLIQSSFGEDRGLT